MAEQPPDTRPPAQPYSPSSSPGPGPAMPQPGVSQGYPGQPYGTPPQGFAQPLQGYPGYLPSPAAPGYPSAPQAAGKTGGSSRSRAPIAVAAAVLISVVALVVATASVVTALRANAAAQAAGVCTPQAWDRVPASSALPSGWTWSSISPYTNGGFGATASQATPSSSSSVSVYVYVICSDNPGAYLAAQRSMNDKSAKRTTIGFAAVGDEVIAERDAQSTNLDVYVRRGQYIVELSTYTGGSSSASINDVETIAKAVVQSLQ